MEYRQSLQVERSIYTVMAQENMNESLSKDKWKTII